MRAYPEYKDSGIEWIGEIPEHWKIKKLKWVIKERLKYGANEVAELEDKNLPRYIRITDFDDNGNLRKDTFKSLLYNKAIDYLLQEGDILFARSGATVGKTFQFKNYNGVACFAGYLIKATPEPNHILSDFLYYYTKSNVYEIWKNNIYSQATIQNIGADKYQYLIIPIPPLEEQQDAGNYIINKTSQIDILISKKQQLIALLKEYRIAIINQAVTKGLNPDVKMKDSGIEWLGEVPVHWEVKKLKYVAEIVLGKMLTPEDKGGYFHKPYLRAQNINWEKANADDIKEMWLSKRELQQYRVKANDLLISEGGEVGRTAIWKDEIPECYIQNSVHKVTMRYGNNPYYFLYLCCLYGEVGYFDSIVSRVSIAHLTREKLKEVYFITPPVMEQNGIVIFLKEQTYKIDTLILKTQQQINLLKEYRTALISEVVTGKIDVRGEM